MYSAQDRVFHSSLLTSLGDVVIFPAPEMEDGCSAIEFTDIYSLGACLWELALGEDAVEPDSDEEEPESPLNPDLE